MVLSDKLGKTTPKEVQVKQTVSVSVESLKASLSDNQLKVAKENYRNIVLNISQYSDVTNIDLDTIKIGVMQRLLDYQL